MSRCCDLFYAGIGSRETPAPILTQMTDIAKFAESRKLILRSGGANGADAAFELGAVTKQIFLPWKGYNGRYEDVYPITDEELATTEKFHWSRPTSPLKSSIRRLMGRNFQIVTGPSDNKQLVEFVVCWTQDGAINDKQRSRLTGGTGQAISIADYFNIPVFNLHHMLAYDECINYIEEITKCQKLK